jgi:hypothetical protein
MRRVAIGLELKYQINLSGEKLAVKAPAGDLESFQPAQTKKCTTRDLRVKI